MQSVIIHNLSNPDSVPLELGICKTFLSRLRGLMFTATIHSNGGLFFINPSEDRLNSAIHMFFMNIDLAIIWVDSAGMVVDKIYAKKWKTLAAPQKGARFILETHSDRLGEYNCGDVLDIKYE